MPMLQGQDVKYHFSTLLTSEGYPWAPCSLLEVCVSFGKDTSVWETYRTLWGAVFNMTALQPYLVSRGSTNAASKQRNWYRGLPNAVLGISGESNHFTLGSSSSTAPLCLLVCKLWRSDNRAVYKRCTETKPKLIHTGIGFISSVSTFSRLEDCHGITSIATRVSSWRVTQLPGPVGIGYQFEHASFIFDLCETGLMIY